MLIPIESKQILFCSYNERDGILYLHYQDGRIVPHGGFGSEQLQTLLEAQNRYDALTQLMSGEPELW